MVGLNSLKIISFGPRPLNFLACNAPIQQLYNIGVEIEENSELDLFEAYNKHAGDERIPGIVKEMEENWVQEQETGDPVKTGSVRDHAQGLGGGTQRIQKICGHCGKMQAGIPDAVRIRSVLCEQPSDRPGDSVSCEVDIYGCLSEFIGRLSARTL